MRLLVLGVVASLTLVAVVAARGGLRGNPDHGTGPAASAEFSARVERVVDGDTFLARAGGRLTRVRLIGADTPETVRPGAPVGCFGLQASAMTGRLLPVGARLRAAYQPGGERDRFGRDLWDVWLPDGRFLAAVLVRAGAARADPVPPQTRYSGELRRLESAARAGGRGLWGPGCRGSPDTR